MGLGNVDVVDTVVVALALSVIEHIIRLVKQE